MMAAEPCLSVSYGRKLPPETDRQGSAELTKSDDLGLRKYDDCKLRKIDDCYLLFTTVSFIL